MARGTRTVYPGKRNKGLSSTFQIPEEGRSVQRPKHCDKHGDKDENNSPKNVYNELIYVPYNPDFGVMIRVFANGPGDVGSIPGQVISTKQITD